MKTSHHHALITGGGSGIGLAIARTLLDAGNRVTIIGRDAARLAAAQHSHPGLRSLAADVSTPEGRNHVQRHVEQHLSDLSLLINNAGAMQVVDLRAAGAASALEYEAQINLVAPMQLSAALLPHLIAQPQAAIVNVSTALIYAPVAPMPAYSASKAGLHAFTRALRWHLQDTRVRVFELVPPPVDTDMSKNFPGSKLAPDVVAKALMEGLARDTIEIAVGSARTMQIMARWAPELLFRKVNEAMGRAFR